MEILDRETFVNIQLRRKRRSMQVAEKQVGAKGRRRRAALTVELILVLPILILVCLATIQFGILMTVHQAVTHAATVAAREAAKGAPQQTLECIVEEVLAPHCLTVGTGPTDCVQVVQEDLGSSVRVTVYVDTDCKPFINPLSSFGFSLANRFLCERAVVPKE